MKNSHFGKVAGIVTTLSLAVASHGQTYTTLYGFDPSGGYGPNSPLVQGLNGNFYGTTSFGGVNHNQNLCFEGHQYGCGTVFEITPTGQYTVIYNFYAQANLCRWWKHPPTG